MQMLLLGFAGSLLGVAHRPRRRSARDSARVLGPSTSGTSSSLLARRALRRDLERRAAGRRHRRPRLAAVLRRPTARSAQRQAVAAAAGRDDVGRPRDLDVAWRPLRTWSRRRSSRWRRGRRPRSRVGLAVCAGFAGVALVLVLAGRGLVALLAPLTASRIFSLRHAVLHLTRPGNQTRVILLAVGLGAFFIVGIRSLQASLLGEFSVQTAEDAPDMFLLDIQAGAGRRRPRLSGETTRTNGTGQSQPLIPARCTHRRGRVAGSKTTNSTPWRTCVDARIARARVHHHLSRSSRSRTSGSSRGAFWGTVRRPEPEVSIERSACIDRFARTRTSATRCASTFLAAMVSRARVTSVRDVEWRESRNGGFVFVFRPGVLDSAPQMYVSPLKGPGTPADRARFQHDLVERFPNVSVIDFREDPRDGSGRDGRRSRSRLRSSAAWCCSAAA